MFGPMNKHHMEKGAMKKYIIIGIAVVSSIVIILAVMSSLQQFFSGVEPAIAEFMEAGVARNVEAACDCWSPQSVSEEEIGELIENSYDVFAGYERLSLNRQSGESSGGIDSCYVSGDIIYAGDLSLPLEASLVKENDVWKITGVHIGSTIKGTVIRPPPSHDVRPDLPW